MFSIVDRHVLRQVSLPLGGALVIGLLMLLADRMVRLLDTTLGKKNSFTVVFEMLAYLVPHYLGTAIPAALFLGLLLGFGKMSANSETDAFMASGIGLNRLARPVILLGIVMSILSLVIVGWLQPHARYAYRSVVFDVQNVDVFYLAEEGVFMQAGDRTFIIDELDRGKNAFKRALGRGPDGRVDFFHSGCTGCLKHQINGADVRRRHTNCHSVQFALQLRQDQANSFGGPG